MPYEPVQFSGGSFETGFVIDKDGNRYEIKGIIRKYYGEVRRVRIHSRMYRFWESLFSSCNDPRSFEDSTLENDNPILVKRNGYVYFPSTFKGKRNLYVGRILCFVAYYVGSKGNTQQNLRLAPTSLDDEVWLEVYAVDNRGSLVAAAMRFVKISLQSILLKTSSLNVTKQLQILTQRRSSN